jgi:PilZ domain
MRKSHLSPDEKRHFHRIVCDGEVIVRYGEAVFKAPLLDLSLKGALTGHPEGWTAGVGTACRLEILLDDCDSAILMDTVVAHVEPNHVGFHCLHIDIDSISFLKRLVELNLGDASVLERELKYLG